MRIIVTICARGGSKGIPGKNIKLIAGKPLIEYTFEVARQFKAYYADTDIALSTDSKEISDLAVQSGFQVPYHRPEVFATDHAGKIGAISDVLVYYENLRQMRYDFVLDLDVTSPLRNLNDLSKAFQMIRNDQEAYNLFSVSPANRNPYFNMVEKGEDGYYHLPKKLSNDIISRQTAPKVFDLNASFYFYRRIFFDKGFQTAITDKSLIYEIPHTCFDLDHPVDFEFLSFLIVNNKIDFNWL